MKARELLLLNFKDRAIAYLEVASRVESAVFCHIASAEVLAAKKTLKAANRLDLVEEIERFEKK